MSENSPMRSRKQKDGDWAFDFRTNFIGLDSSDSESEDVMQLASDKRLMNELDLSTRDEQVSYKPNPFSIAKINAAHRVRRGDSNILNRRAPGRLSKATKDTSQTTIMDGFKVQASKASRIAVGTAQAELSPSDRESKPITAFEHHSEATCNSFDSAPDDSTHQGPVGARVTPSAPEQRAGSSVVSNCAHISTFYLHFFI